MFGELTLRKKIVIIITVTVVAVALVVWLLIYRMESRLLLSTNNQMLTRYIDAFTRAGKRGGVEEIRAMADIWNRMYPEGRLTLLDLDGDVLLDTSSNPGIMDNHYRRPEIVEAMRAGQGTDLRFSPTMEEWLNYVARRIEIPERDGNKTYVFRVGYPVERLRSLAVSVGVGFAATLCITFMLVWLICYWMLRLVMKPLLELNKTAEAIAEGRPARFPVTSSLELRKLSDVLNTMYDTLEQKAGAEEQGRKELSTVFETLPLGVIILDKNKKISYINRIAVELCGLDIEDRPMPGTSVEIVLPSVEMCKMIYGPDVRKVISTASRGGMHLEVTTVTLLTTQMIVINDLTEKIHLEEARRDFFIDAGHEFQTPLAVIRMGLELMRGTAEQKHSEDRDMVERLITQQERISQLVDDLLFLVKLDADPLKVEYEKIDAFALTKELAADMKEVPYAKEITLTYDVPEEGVSFLFGRTEDLRRSIFNLLENACKYVSSFRKEGGKVTMTIRDTGDRWIIDVDDNGPGVPETERDTIFQRFRRGEEHRARRGIAAGGYGLGLSIARRIAERHGGTLELLEDARLGGSSFRMILPKREPHAD